MEKTGTNISSYIDSRLLESLQEYVKIEKAKRFPSKVNRSEVISKFIKEGLDRNYPNYKYGQILKNAK